MYRCPSCQERTIAWRDKLKASDWFPALCYSCGERSTGPDVPFVGDMKLGVWGVILFIALLSWSIVELWGLFERLLQDLAGDFLAWVAGGLLAGLLTFVAVCALLLLLPLRRLTEPPWQENASSGPGDRDHSS